MDGWMRVSGYLTDKNTANFVHITATFTLTVKSFPFGSCWGAAPFLKKIFFFPTVDVLVDEQDLKEYKLWRFSFFSIPCISCMLMFCACFCKDWMRYCNIFATIALDSCTSQLSINMLKE